VGIYTGRRTPVLTFRAGHPDKVLERDLVVQAVSARLNWGLKTEFAGAVGRSVRKPAYLQLQIMRIRYSQWFTSFDR
jgi:hypothetical protein